MTTARTAPTRAARPDRRPELDAIRTLVVLGLVFFHASLVFDTRDDFYVKNAETTEVTTILAGLAVVWAMPALFLISGLRFSIRTLILFNCSVERISSESELVRLCQRLCSCMTAE